MGMSWSSSLNSPSDLHSSIMSSLSSPKHALADNMQETMCRGESIKVSFQFLPQTSVAPHPEEEGVPR